MKTLIINHENFGSIKDRNQLEFLLRSYKQILFDSSRVKKNKAKKKIKELLQALDCLK